MKTYRGYPVLTNVETPLFIFCTAAYRRDQEVVERKARYSLIVSISTEDAEIDLYAMIANEIQTRVEAQAAGVDTEIWRD